MLRTFTNALRAAPGRALQPGQVLLVVVLLLAFPAAAVDEASIRVQPDLCMTTAQQPRCELTVAIDWQAPAAADYCVRDNLPDQQTIQCWQQVEKGATTDSRFVDRSFEYQLIEDQGVDGDATVAARATVKVMAARSTDRRRNRRRRHVWSVL